jgi:hypothetical protein
VVAEVVLDVVVQAVPTRRRRPRPTRMLLQRTPALHRIRTLLQRTLALHRIRTRLQRTRRMRALRLQPADVGAVVDAAAGEDAVVAEDVEVLRLLLPMLFHRRPRKL